MKAGISVTVIPSAVGVRGAMVCRVVQAVRQCRNILLAYYTALPLDRDNDGIACEALRGNVMGFRFRKSIRLLPGVRVNLSKSGVSTSIGRPGATVNIGKRGLRATVGLPGTGLSYSEQVKLGKAGSAGSDSPAPGKKASGRWLLLLIIVFAVALMLSGCQQQKVAGEAKWPAENKGPIKPASWVQVGTTSENKAVYVNANSIFPHKDGLIAEVALPAESMGKFNGFAFIANCKTRMVSEVNLVHGVVANETPPASWTMSGAIYNYICFGQAGQAYKNKVPVTDLDVSVSTE
jgi:hypothetical protein